MMKQIRLNGVKDKQIIALRNAWDREQESKNRSYMILRGFEIYRRYGEVIQLAVIPYKDITKVSSDVIIMALYIPNDYPSEELIKKGLFSKQIKEYLKAAISIVDDEESGKITSVEQFDNIYMSIIRNHTKIVTSIEPYTPRTPKTPLKTNLSLKGIQNIKEVEEMPIESEIEGGVKEQGDEKTSKIIDNTKKEVEDTPTESKMQYPEGDAKMYDFLGKSFVE